MTQSPVSAGWRLEPDACSGSAPNRSIEQSVHACGQEPVASSSSAIEGSALWTGVSLGRVRASGTKLCVLSDLVPRGAGKPGWPTHFRPPGRRCICTGGLGPRPQDPLGRPTASARHRGRDHDEDGRDDGYLRRSRPARAATAAAGGRPEPARLAFHAYLLFGLSGGCVHCWPNGEDQLKGDAREGKDASP
jgi:hypothetical protein